MIRDITPDDKPQILRLVEMFFKERLEKTGTLYSPDHACAHFDLFIKAPGILALCAEEEGKIVGMIVGISSAIIFAKELAMQEMVWYVEPDKRKCGLKLLREFERRSKELGLQYVMMVGMSGDPVVDFYPRVGYAELEKIFIKALN
jgi:predicted N-acetyltransferase YhbS